MKRVANSLCLLVLASIAYADLDPCPTKERDFKTSATIVRSTWHRLSDDLESRHFDRIAFDAEVRRNLLIQSLKDINETVDAVNATLAPKKQKMTVTKANRAAAAQYKVTAMLARPEMRKYYDQMARDAENAFLEEKAKRMLELAQEKKNMDSGIDQEQKKLEDNCKYDAVSQLQRVALQVLQIDMRIENGMLKIGDFKTDLPVLNAGKVMLGGHHLMDLPVVKDGSVQIGGTSIAPLPLVAQGQVLLPATVIAKALKIDLPLVNTPVTVGPVTIGAKDHGGLGVTVGNWKF